MQAAGALYLLLKKNTQNSNENRNGGAMNPHPNKEHQFKKGQSGNPGGRPKKDPAYKGLGSRCVDELKALLDDKSTPNAVRVQICKIIMEYDFGKPAQQIQLEADLGEKTQEALFPKLTLAEKQAKIKSAMEKYNAKGK